MQVILTEAEWSKVQCDRDNLKKANEDAHKERLLGDQLRLALVHTRQLSTSEHGCIHSPKDDTERLGAKVLTYCDECPLYNNYPARTRDIICTREKRVSQ